MARYYIGIDGGGTATRALLTDETGLVLGVGFSSSANRNHYTRDQARRSLSEAVNTARRGMPAGTALSAVFLGMSGVSIQSDQQEVLDIVGEIPEIGSNVRVAVENDTVAALTGGLAGQAGLVLIAGTGSACLGVNERGQRWLCGGWGALADDAGSAPWVGVRALQAAVRAQDGRAAPTALREIVFDFLGLSEPRQLIHRIHNQGLERSEIGAIAPRVAAACLSGDAAACTILEEAAAELSHLAKTTVRKLFGDTPCKMILIGGLARSGPPFQTMLTERLGQDVPNLAVIEPILTPVQGAVLEAMRLDDQPWTEQIIANLKSSNWRNDVVLAL